MNRTPLQEMICLDGQTAVVTGGALGIGSAISARLAEAGATVCVADIARSEAERCCAEIRQRGGAAFFSLLDVTAPAASDNVASEVVSRTWGLDIWVNNAGIYRLEPCLGTADAVWRQTLDINLTGVHRASRAAAWAMLAAEAPGCIVNVASVAALRAGHPSLVGYAASKAGVVSLTQNLAAALGPFGIRVVAVSPGVVLSESMQRHLDRLTRAGSGAADRAGTLPLRRLADPDDVARVVVFLCSELAGYLTGQNLVVDGGDSVSAARARARAWRLCSRTRRDVSRATSRRSHLTVGRGASGRGRGHAIQASKTKGDVIMTPQTDKVVVITGAGAGIGAATSRRFLEEGAKVVAVDHDVEALTRLMTSLQDFSSRVLTIEADVSAARDHERIASAARERFGRIDVLVANAGQGLVGTARDTEEADWNRIIDTNLKGVWLAAKHVLPMMCSQRAGAIINMASITALHGYRAVAAYSAAKGGIVALTRQMAADYAQFGIRINAIAPGTVHTQLTQGLWDNGGGFGGQGTDPAGQISAAAQGYPLGRLGDPTDIANMVLFLAGDEATWVTGSVFVVDGGKTAC